MTCRFDRYKTFWYKPGREYVTTVFNIKEYERGNFNLRMNILVGSSEPCRCERCKPYTGSDDRRFDSGNFI